MKLTTKEQNKLIAEERKKWEELFTDLPKNKQNAANKLIERVAFMTITLTILEDDIKEKGPVIPFENGSQKMTVENPSQKSYNTMINRYTAACDKLFNLLPEEKAEELKEQQKRSAKDLL